MIITKEQKPWFENSILRLAALVGAIALIVKTLNDYVLISKEVTPGFYTIIFAGLNALVLIIFCLVSSRTPTLDFNSKTKGKDEYAKLFDFFNDDLTLEKANKLSERNNRRANLLVRQLNKNIVYFALILSITYILFIFDDETSPNHFAFKVAEDITNFLSSTFLYLSFKVMYDKTLEDDELNSKYNYYTDAVIVSGVYILAYIIFVVAKINISQNTRIVTNLFSLFAGIFNGLAMTLLFARYISMEHSVSKIDEIKYNDVISLLTIFVLPLYTLAQPLFGNFEIRAFGDDPKIFMNWVFVVCFFGKVFFLFMTYYFIRRKLIHLYMHMVLTRHDASNKLASCFDLDTK